MSSTIVGNVPLTQTIAHRRFITGTEVTDFHGNHLPQYEPAEDVPCVYYLPDQSAVTEGGHRVETDCVAYIPASTTTHPRDYWYVGGLAYAQEGTTGDYNHGPWWNPGLLVLNLRRVEDLP